MRVVRRLALTSALAALVTATPGLAQFKPAVAAPDLDARGAAPRAMPDSAAHGLASEAQASMLDTLRQTVPGLTVRWSALTGAPSRLLSVVQPLTDPSPLEPQVVARNFIEQNLTLLGLSPDDIAQLTVTRNYVTRHNGVTHLTFQQQIDGRDVIGGVIVIDVDSAGRILSLSGEPIPGARQAVNAAKPATTLDQAIGTAAARASVAAVRAARGAGLVYFPVARGRLRLAWNVTVEDSVTPNVYQTLVDALSGEILWRKNLTMYSHIDTHGLVFTDEGPNPNIPTGTTTGQVPRQDTLFLGAGIYPHDDPHYDWWNGSGEADRNTTKSNNVRAKQDRDGDNDDGEGFFTTASENFNPPLDLTIDPSNSTNAAITNLFYWNNRIHDFYYRLGFDEAAGNFQSDNFGLGGSGGDPVQADAQDNRDGADPSLCNANMSTPADGSSPRMQMFQCDNLSPERDGDLDNPVIQHEFGHGLHSRLVPTSGFQRANEGWGDYSALALSHQPGDNLDGNYELGWWLFGGGIRRQPYSSDQSVFTRTYADITDGANCQLGTCSNNASATCDEDADCGAGNVCNFFSCQFHFQCASPPKVVDLGLCAPEVHNTGELWAETLWLMRVNLVRKYGFGTGAETANLLVVDGMKLSPNDPDFLDDRDGILQADLVNNGGVNQCLIWNAFAKMGMGPGAVSGGVNDINPVEDFDTPSTCTPNIDVSAPLDFGDVCPGDFDTLQLEVFNNGTADLEVTSVTRISGSSTISVDPLPATPLLVSPSAHIDFTVRCEPTTTGSKTATIRIESSDPDQPQIDLVYTCDVPAASIETLIAGGGDFGDVCVGAFKDLDLTISNDGGCDLQVDDVTAGGPNTAAFAPAGGGFPLTVAPGNSIAVPIRFSPTSFGAKSATLHVHSRTANDGVLPDENIPVSGNAPPGDISVTGSTDFGDVCAGALAEKIVSVCNTGTLCTLHVSQALLSQPGLPHAADCADFTIVNNPFPSDVSHDFCLPLTVRFTPTSAGPKACDLVLLSDDPDEGTVVLTVTGNTPAPAIDVPGDQGFPPEVIQSVGACSTALPFPVSNTGECLLKITNFSISVNPDEYSLSGLPSFPILLEPGHIAGEGDLATVFAPDVIDRARLGQVEVTYVSDPILGTTTTVHSALCGEGVRTGARVLVTSAGIPLDQVKKIHLRRVVGNANGNHLDTVDTALDLPLETVTPTSPCGSFQYHREYGTVSNPIQLLPGSYKLTVTAKIGNKQKHKTVGFDVTTCDFNPTIVVDF